MPLEGAFDVICQFLNRDCGLLVRTAERAPRDDTVAIDHPAQEVLTDAAPADPFHIFVDVQHNILRAASFPPLSSYCYITQHDITTSQLKLT